MFTLCCAHKRQLQTKFLAKQNVLLLPKIYFVNKRNFIFKSSYSGFLCCNNKQIYHHPYYNISLFYQSSSSSSPKRPRPRSSNAIKNSDFNTNTNTNNTNINTNINDTSS